MSDALAKVLSDALAKGQAIQLLTAAAEDLQRSLSLLCAKPTRANRVEAFRLLSGVQAACETVKLSIRD